jgi:cation transport regulator ChaB
MPYSRNADLPKSVRDHLSLGAQTSYRKAYNSSWKQYGDAASLCQPRRDGPSCRVGGRQKESYSKRSGRWVRTR